MTRTLLISDLHIGTLTGRGVIQQRRPLELLLAQLREVDRLVLLGDALELCEGRPPREVMALAAPILAALGEAVRELIVLPGNHDRPMIATWIADQGADLAVENAVPADASPLLAEMCERLGSGGGSVAVHYPGLTLSPTIWVTHGHYIDRILMPQGPFGLMRRRVHPDPAFYERRWGQGQRRRRHLPVGPREMLQPRFAPLTAALLDLQMRHRSLPALAGLLGALGVRSEHIVFGHVHRLGPMPSDRLSDWQLSLAPGAPPARFANTGSWQYEPLLIGHQGPPNPYRPGGAVLIEDDGVPRAVGLLDSLELSAT